MLYVGIHHKLAAGKIQEMCIPKGYPIQQQCSNGRDRGTARVPNRLDSIVTPY